MRRKLSLSLSGPAVASALGLADASLPGRLDLTIPLEIRKRGQETRLVLGRLDRLDRLGRHAPDAKLVALLDQAEDAAARLLRGEATSVRALAGQLGIDHRRLARTLPLAWLAPDITAAIRSATQPAELTPSAPGALDPLPLAWPDQRRALQMPAPD